MDDLIAHARAKLEQERGETDALKRRNSELAEHLHALELEQIDAVPLVDRVMRNVTLGDLTRHAQRERRLDRCNGGPVTWSHYKRECGGRIR